MPHLPAALVAAAAFAIAFGASLAFLRTRNFRWDAAAVASTEAGLAMLAVALVTGAIAGRHPLSWVKITLAILAVLLALATAALLAHR